MSTNGVVIGTGKLGSLKHLSPKQRIAFEIYEFESLEKKKHFTSPVNCHGYQWWLQICPWGHPDFAEAKAQEMTSIYLSCKKTSSDQARPKAKYTIQAGGKTNSDTKEFNKTESWGWSEFSKRSELLSKLDTNGTLVVHVDISIMTENFPIWKPQRTFQQKMERLLHDDKDTDVTFVLPGGCLVRAHRFVLKIQSPTLSDFAEEAKEGRVHIERADPDLFAGMVRFMYTNSLPIGFDLKKDGIELLKLANTFGCNDLKMVMEATIIEADVLTIENAAEMLLLADANDSAQLKEAAMDLVVSNPTKTMQTEGWKDLQESRSLLVEFFQGVSKATEKSKGPTDSNDPDQLSVSSMRKRLADANLDADGTRETLVKRLKRAKADGN